MRLELTRPNGHYPLKVARLPIPPLLHNYAKLPDNVPRTGLEPARLSTLAPETSASTIPPPGQLPLSGKRGSNSRPQPWQGCALPTELFPRFCSTNWAILAFLRITPHYASFCLLNSKFQRERKTRLELATPTLARLCSTNWAISAFTR